MTTVDSAKYSVDEETGEDSLVLTNGQSVLKEDGIKNETPMPRLGTTFFHFNCVIQLIALLEFVWFCTAVAIIYNKPRVSTFTCNAILDDGFDVFANELNYSCSRKGEVSVFGFILSESIYSLTLFILCALFSRKVAVHLSDSYDFFRHSCIVSAVTFSCANLLFGGLLMQSTFVNTSVSVTVLFMFPLFQIKYLYSAFILGALGLASVLLPMLTLFVSPSGIYVLSKGSIVSFAINIIFFVFVVFHWIFVHVRKTTYAYEFWTYVCGFFIYKFAARVLFIVLLG